MFSVFLQLAGRATAFAMSSEATSQRGVMGAEAMLMSIARAPGVVALKMQHVHEAVLANFLAKPTFALLVSVSYFLVSLPQWSQYYTTDTISRYHSA